MYHEKFRKINYLIVLVIGIFIGGGIVWSKGIRYPEKQENLKQIKLKNNRDSAIELVGIKGNSPVSKAANDVIPAVVGIVSTKIEREFAYSREVKGVGSGIIVDSEGYVLTNNHVADINARDIRVFLYDGREVKGRTIWADSTLDLSIVKIKGDNLTTAILGDSENVAIGETAIAIGNPLGLKFQRTVTAGIISALNRTIQIEEGIFMEDLIQTDASINPGNSGGPLININGEVIGINTVKVSSAEGIGFAVPVDIMKPIISSIKKNGEFLTPILGIVSIDREMIGYMDKKFNRGIYVYRTSKTAPAYKAGIREGDIILSIDEIEVNTVMQLKEVLYNAGVGSIVKVKAHTPSGTKIFDIKLARAD